MDTLTEAEKWERQVAYWQSDLYGERVAANEAQGMTTSDAQACADAEFICNGYKEPTQ